MLKLKDMEEVYVLDMHDVENCNSMYYSRTKHSVSIVDGNIFVNKNRSIVGIFNTKHWYLTIKTVKK